MPAKKSGAAFVIMPFAPEFQVGFEDVIAPGVRAAGLECVRADQEALGHIHQMMFERLFESPVVVADVSGTNPNVFYELGVAHCTASKTVTVVREDYRDRIPFDIAPYRVLVYPKRPDASAGDKETAAYDAAASAAAAALADSITAVLDVDAGGIANPVQDFLATRSPLTCGESRHIERFTETHEEEMVRTAVSDIVAVGITSSHFCKVLARVVEEGERTAPLRIRILSLARDDRSDWRYVYHLREGHPVADDGLEELLAEDAMIIEQTSRILRRLNARGDCDAEIAYFSAIPLFWAYMIDDERIIVGNLAMNRVSSRMPVSVFVRDDPRTRSAYRYHASTIEALAAGAVQG